MGNTLCKDRVNQTSNSKSPVDRVIGRCAEICPNTLGKRKHFWEKQVLETSPPHQTQPKMDNSGWHNAPLTVPDSPTNNTGKPVAPPRKKRPSMLRKDDPPTRNGFKEIFSGQRADSTTESESQDNGDAKDFSDFEKVPLNRADEKAKEQPVSEVSRSSEERSEERSEDDRPVVTLTHKVSKVGNKKSDKFFGENLSDCLSDEPVTQSGDSDSDGNDNVDKTVSKESEKPMEEKSVFDTNVEYSEEMIRAINKERGALLFAMRNATDDEGEDVPDNAKPVEEPLIVPKRVVRKHICDEDDKLRPHIHHNHNHNSLTPDPNAPKKPQRDFSKYKKSLEDSKPEKEVTSSSPTKPELNQAEYILSNVSTKPAITEAEMRQDIKKVEAKSIVSSDPSTEAIGNKMDSKLSSGPTLKRVSESIPAKMSQSEKVLRRCLSTQSYLTPELVEKIAQQASFSHGFLPEDFSSFSNDGSGMAPNSKLEQKRSLSTQSSQLEQKIASLTKLNVAIATDLENKRPSFSIGSTQLDSSLGRSETQQTDDNTPIEEPETPPVYAKLTAPMPLLATSFNLDQTDASTVSQQNEKPILKSIEKVSSSDDISKAIKTFVEKDDIKPEDVLILLEEEFGELLHSTTLPEKDREVIEDLKNIVDSKLKAEVETNPFIESKFISKTVETTVQESQPSRKATIQEMMLDSNESKPKSLVFEPVIPDESRTISSESFAISPKVSPEISPAVPSTVSKLISDEMLMNDKRRHSIDEFDHWFAGSLAQNKDVPERKRKREASLPGYLITEVSIGELDIPTTFKADSDDEDATDDSSNKKESPIISKIESIPEHPKLETPASNKSIETDVRSTDNNQNDTNHKIINNITNNVYAISAEDKRKSVGHSLLLKFLDGERTNSYQ